MMTVKIQPVSIGAYLGNQLPSIYEICFDNHEHYYICTWSWNRFYVVISRIPQTIPSDNALSSQHSEICQ